MNFGISIYLVNNVSLLLALSIIYAFVSTKKLKFRGPKRVLAGCIIGLVGVVIMYSPFSLAPGVMLDVRSIIISMSGLFFGLIPTIIAVVMTSLFRIYQGGGGTFVGVCVIVLSAVMGLLWRHFRFSKLVEKKRARWLEVYLLGIITHIGMLVCFLFLPRETAFTMLKTISLPVIIIYPLGTVLLGMILLKQIDNEYIYWQLNESEKRYRSIFDQAQLGICNISLEGRFINANQKCCELLGYSLEELKQLLIMDITYPDDRETVRIESAKMLNNEIDKIVMEIRYLKKDGTLIYLENLTSLIIGSSNNPEYTMTTFEDITGKKRLEEEKRNIDAHLIQQQRLESIGTLASGVAHEINNPINGIMNYGQLILDSYENDSENAKYAKEIVFESERIAKIVGNLLQFSRQKNQKYSYVNINTIIDHTLSLIKTVMRHDQIELQVDVQEDISELKCRSQQIQQVVMNLLTNARDALNQKYKGYHKDKIIKLRCEQFERHNQKWIKITVEDHGNGIPKDVQRKVFDPFFSTKAKEKGTGLGLSISHGIVKEHQGELNFETKEGSYSIFYLDLPCDPLGGKNV